MHRAINGGGHGGAVPAGLPRWGPGNDNYTDPVWSVSCRGGSTYEVAFDRREVFEMYYRLSRHDGAYRWIFDRGVPIFDGQGVFSGYVGSCIDVTERREAKIELNRRQEAELLKVSKLLPVCAWCKKIRDDDGDWREVDEYLNEHQKLTHCMCAECSERVMKDMQGNEPT